MKPNPLPVLYSFRRCPYAMGARLALAFSGQAYELREILLRDKPAEMLDISPKGTVPVLQLPNGLVIDESLDIAKWAFGQTEQGNVQNQGGEDLLKELLSDFIPALNRYKYPDRYDLPDGLNHRTQAVIFLEKLDQKLQGNHFLWGTNPSLFDVLIFPFARQFRVVDRNWFDKEIALPSLLKWMSFFTEHSLFKKAMAKHDPWRQTRNTSCIQKPGAL